MKSICIIAKRELISFFDSLMAYIFIVLFLGITGFFTWLYGNTIFLANQANLQVFFFWCYWTLLFFIPAITMRTIAEEKKTGTIELLSTKAVSDWHIVAGKFLGSFLLVAITLVCTLPYYLTVSYLGDVDHGSVWGGYLGLMLISGAYISIGVFASSITHNQIIALLVTLIICTLLQLIFPFLSQNLIGVFGNLLSYSSAATHYESISRGVIDSRDLIYFLSVIVTGLLFAQAALSKRNWQE